MGETRVEVVQKDLQKAADMAGLEMEFLELIADHEQAVSALREEIERLRVDAERYRWLRQFKVDSYLAGGSGEKLDAEIDGAKERRA